MSILAEAISAHQAGNLDHAERLYRQLIRKSRDLFHAKHYLGALYLQRGDAGDAERLIRQALILNTSDDTAYYNYGMALAALGRHQEAVESFDRALALNSRNAGAHNNRGVVLHSLRQYGEAVASFDRAIALESDFAEARYNRDNALLAIGKNLFEQNLDQEALAIYDQVTPDHAEAYYNKAHVKLSIGNFAEGWPLLEWRWKIPTYTQLIRTDRPLWLGDADLSGKTILVHAEQGMGDAIQLCRYLPLLQERGARVILVVPPPLVSLFPDMEVVTIGDALPPCDFHCPLFSLPLAFGTTLDTIPAPVSYLVAPPDKVAALDELLGAKTRPRVGLAWSGNPQLGHDHRRTMRLEELLPILTDEVEWFSLQKDVRDYDRAALGRAPLRDLTSRLNNFADTAALISHLDVVISVDTSVAHLAGALGKPIWLMLPFHPDFRWLRDREDSPWYPTARLFRQAEPGVWVDVVERIRSKIRHFGLP